MGWKKILKSRTRPEDIKNLGNIYALKDIYESKLLREEEYNELPHLHESTGRGRRKGSTRGEKYLSKLNYHENLYGFLDRNKDSPSYEGLKPYKAFHRTMERRLRMDRERDEVTPTFPTLEIFQEKGDYLKTDPTRGRAREKTASDKMARMLRNLFNAKGLQTKEEVEEIIRREMTAGEFKTYMSIREEFE